MLTLILIATCWLASSLLSYILIRRDQRTSFGKWKRIDRLAALSMSLAWGPFMLLTIVGVLTFVKVSASEWANQEVRW